MPNAGTANKAEDNVEREPPVTLLQLRDGSMYGLTEYWVEGDELHYFTTYRGEGSVPIERIDFEKTAKLNAGRGVEFALRPKPTAPPRYKNNPAFALPSRGKSRVSVLLAYLRAIRFKGRRKLTL